MKSTLLLSFIARDELYDALTKISETTRIHKSSIFVFRAKDLDSYILTYNLSSNDANIKFDSIWPNTISIHRKKQTNTLYSLNAMNQLIKDENNGVLNKTHIIDWKNYNDSLLITKGGQLKIFELKLVKVNL